MRPPPAERRFTAPSIEAIIAEYQPKFKNPQLGQIFANTLPNTLDTTVYSHTAEEGKLDTYVITGDITAMWLRDSANQVAPYMRFAAKDPALSTLIAGLVIRQSGQVLTDPYANAHQIEGSPPSPHSDDSTSRPAFAGARVDAMTMSIFERKFEIDSLANFLHLSAEYFAVAGKDSPAFTQAVNAAGNTWVDAAKLAIATLQAQQIDTVSEGNDPPYQFQRETSQPTDSLESGRGTPARYTGMIKTGFRPSDDSHKLPYNIPGNAYVVVALREAAVVLTALGETTVAGEATTLAGQVEDGIRTHGIIHHPAVNDTVYAYEVDGYGSYYFMDDANLPSLLALPVYGWANTSDRVYQRTRSLVLSEANPWYFAGSAGAGVGGPHDGLFRVWPMSFVSMAQTATDEAELTSLVDLLVASTGCTGLMHESIDMNDAGSYTRPWFAWANSYFAGLILDIADKFPSIIFNQ